MIDIKFETIKRLSIPNEAYKLIRDVLKEEGIYSNKDFFINNFNNIM